jgi:hypothetical protein
VRAPHLDPYMHGMNGILVAHVPPSKLGKERAWAFPGRDVSNPTRRRTSLSFFSFLQRQGKEDLAN